MLINIKRGISFVAIIIGILCLINVITHEIGVPIVMIALSLTNFICAYEGKKADKKSMSFMSLSAGLILFVTAIYIAIT